MISTKLEAAARNYSVDQTEGMNAAARPEMINSGDRVLVSEYPNGKVWHTATRATFNEVFTEEVPQGFSRVFVLEVKAACESCGVIEGTRHNDFCG